MSTAIPADPQDARAYLRVVLLAAAIGIPAARCSQVLRARALPRALALERPPGRARVRGSALVPRPRAPGRGCAHRRRCPALPSRRQRPLAARGVEREAHSHRAWSRRRARRARLAALRGRARPGGAGRRSGLRGGLDGRPVRHPPEDGGLAVERRLVLGDLDALRRAGRRRRAPRRVRGRVRPGGRGLSRPRRPGRRRGRLPRLHRVRRLGGLETPGLVVPDLPLYDGVDFGDLGVGLVVGVLAAFVAVSVGLLARRVDGVGGQLGMPLLLVGGGLAVGGLAVLADLLGADSQDVLFSGQASVPDVVAEDSTKVSSS